MAGALTLASLVTNPKLTAANFSVSDFALSPTDAGAAIAYESDGDVTGEKDNGSNTNETDWITPKSAAPSSYEIRCTLDSGGPLDGSSAAVDTWLALTSLRRWKVLQTGIGVRTASLTIEFRFNGGPVLRTVTGTITADVDV